MKMVQNPCLVSGVRAWCNRLLAATTLLCLAGAAAAQAYPAKPVTLVVGFAPGGSVDQAARLVAEPLARLLGQPFIVENRPGAAATIAHAAVVRAPKDGHSVLVAYNTTNACSPALIPKLAWDPVKDLTPVGMMVASSVVLVVPASLPVKTLPEFIAHLKQRPGQLNYGSSGIGSQAHIIGEMFLQKTGTKMVHVPFKGSGDLMPSLLSGTIQMAFGTTSAFAQQVQAGRLRALAVTGMTRDPLIADVPTANEAGVPGFDIDGWLALFVPAGTPQQAISALADALKRTTEQPEFRQRVKAAGMEVRYQPADAVAAKVRQEIEECTATVRNAGIRLE